MRSPIHILMHHERKQLLPITIICFQIRKLRHETSPMRGYMDNGLTMFDLISNFSDLELVPFRGGERTGFRGQA